MLRNCIWLGLCCAFAVWLAGLCWFVTIIPKKPANDTAQADAIVVLTGGSHRLEHGFELLAQGRAPKMFISGVEDGVTVASLLHEKDYRKFSGRIDPSGVELGHKARSTTGNASEVADWVMREHVRSIRLVTGNYHMPRSVGEIRQAVPQLEIFPEPVFPGHFEDDDWWKFSDGVRLVISEYHKYIVMLIHHAIL